MFNKPIEGTLASLSCDTIKHALGRELDRLATAKGISGPAELDLRSRLPGKALAALNSEEPLAGENQRVVGEALSQIPRFVGSAQNRPLVIELERAAQNAYRGVASGEDAAQAGVVAEPLMKAARLLRMNDLGVPLKDGERADVAKALATVGKAGQQRLILEGTVSDLRPPSKQ
jgi:hypothetical protein